ncbi:NUDIX domain-containing protein [Micromonospora sp. CPCC 205371]|nr:NUDIX domain-containing protein [Micromonospora sp. CPCC 205371]
MSTYARRSARILLLDAADRLLLIRSLHISGQPDGGHAWFTPGGGIEPGEDLATAAARELHEEIGLRADPADFRHVAYTTGHADLGWANGLFRDDFLLHRVSSHDVDTTGQNDLERSHYAGHRWWTAGELATTTETIYPNRLANVVSDLLTGQIPEQPIELPWHH